MAERSTVRSTAPLVPEWLATRQLNGRLTEWGVLMEGLSIEDLIDILDEENDYDGPYSPELLAMLNGVDSGFIACLKRDPIFFREVFEPWYFDAFAPRIFDCKLPMRPPRLRSVSGSGGAGGFLILIVLAVLASGWFLFSSLFDIATIWSELCLWE